VIAQGGVTGPDIEASAVGPHKMKLDKLVKFLQTRVNGSCPEGQTVQGILADGSVLCAEGNAGTITSVTPSGGLTGGGTSGDVALGVDPSVIQSRVTDSCSGNEAVQSVGQNGGVGCQAITANGTAGGDLTGSFPNPGLANGSIDSAGLFGAGLIDGPAGNATLRSLGTGAAQAAAGNDPRLSDARVPTGSAGGDLAGTYPNPTIGSGKVDADNFAALPGGRMVQTTCQTVPDSGFHNLNFDSADYTHDAVFSSANDSLTLQVAGTYLITGYAEWAVNGNGSRALAVNVTAPGASAFDLRTASGQSSQGQTAISVAHIPANTVLTGQVGQGSGSDLSLVDFGSNCASITAQWLGP
jgi:hypothetical protein